MKNLIRLLILAPLFMFLATGCDQLMTFLEEDSGDNGGDNGGNNVTLMVYNLSASFQDGGVQLSWEYVNGANGYDIWISTSEFGSYQHVDTIYSGSTNYSHNSYSFTSYTYYYYKIRVIDFDGQYHDYSNPVFVYVQDVSTNTGVVNNFAVNMSGSSAHLTWDYNSSAYEYELEYATNESGPWYYLATLYGDTEYYHNGLNSNTYYYYRIGYYNYDYFWSGYTDPIFVYTGSTGPSQVTGVYAYGDYGVVYLSWDYLSDADYYEVWASYDEYSGYVLIGEAYSTSFSDDYAAPGYYNYYQIRAVDYDGNYGEFSTTYGVYLDIFATQIYLDEWFTDYIISGQVKWYAIYGYNGSVLLGELNDYDSGSQTQYGDVNITVFHTDQYTVYDGADGIDNTDSGLAIPVPFGETETYIRVIGESEGYFGLYFMETYLDDNALLSSLNVEVDQGSISEAFDPYVTDYYISATPDSTYINFSNIVTESLLAYTSITINGMEYDLDGSFDVDLSAYPEGVDITVTVVSSDETNYMYYNFYVTTASSDNNLNSLDFSNGALDIIFSNDAFYYQLNVDSVVEDISITAVASDPDATIYINDNIVSSGATSTPVYPEFGLNENMIVIDVHAPNGEVRTFYIDVFREPTADIDELNISNAIEFEYDETSLTYTVTTEIGLDSINVEVVTADPTATVYIESVLGDTKTVALAGDFVDRYFQIIVTPNYGAGTSVTYQVIVTPSWTVDNPGGESVLYYSFPVDIYNTYTVQWDDKVNGSGTFNEDILVTALYMDGVSIYTELNSVNSGYNSPVTLTANESGYITLMVEAVDGGILEDDFALRVYDDTYGSWVEFMASGDNTIVVE